MPYKMSISIFFYSIYVEMNVAKANSLRTLCELCLKPELICLLDCISNYNRLYDYILYKTINNLEKVYTGNT